MHPLTQCSLLVGGVDGGGAALYRVGQSGLTVKTDFAVAGGWWGDGVEDEMERKKEGKKRKRL